MVHNIIRDIRLPGFWFRDEKSGTSFVIGWCFECVGWHTHGGFKTEPELGFQLHRAPHCDSESYSKQEYEGYVIEIVGPAPSEVLADYLRKNPVGLKAQGWSKGETPIAQQSDLLQ